MAVLLQVATCLARFHAAGLVHNNLKPENILWLPSCAAWLVVDLGCAAPVGRPAPAGCKLECALLLVLNTFEADGIAVFESFRTF